MLRVLPSLLFLPAFLVILAAARSPVEGTVVDSAGKAVGRETLILRRADGTSLQETGVMLQADRATNLFCALANLSQ